MSVDYLVTGGGGFIGSNIVQRLVSEGAGVRVLDNFSNGRRENLAEVEGKIDLQVGDLRNVDDVEKAVTGAKYVLHLGALGSVVRSVEDPLTSHDVNVTGTLNLLIAARDAGVERLVLSSSSSVYGDTPTLPKREDMMPNPLSPYALNKLAGEHYCKIFYRLYGLKTFVLRYFNVFGPRQDPNSQYAAVIPLFIDAFHNDTAPTIDGDGGQTRDFTFVEDVIDGNLCCCSAPEEAAGGVYNLAWGYRTSINELASKIAEIMGKDIEPIHGPTRAGDVRDSQADSTLAKELLGWKPSVPFDEGLTRTIEWFLR